MSTAPTIPPASPTAQQAATRNSARRPFPRGRPRHQPQLPGRRRGPRRRRGRAQRRPAQALADLLQEAAVPLPPPLARRRPGRRAAGTGQLGDGQRADLQLNRGRAALAGDQGLRLSHLRQQPPAARETADPSPGWRWETERWSDPDKDQAKQKTDKQLQSRQRAAPTSTGAPRRGDGAERDLYTGMVDTVCTSPSGAWSPRVEPGNPRGTCAGAAGSLRRRLAAAGRGPVLDLRGPDWPGPRRPHVGYFFHCNGAYDPQPGRVRGKLQNLFEPMATTRRSN